ncbi:MAG TPA: menaquinone biosynthesis protein [Flavipsychrobacter sp.]|nr:menaquinone biosynthesis protein [Flavipsychrobacter sp.]
MKGKIKVGSVSYLNAKPLLYGIERSEIINEIELSEEYPAEVARKLKNNEIDVALLPVAAMSEIEGARIVCDYGIAADGNVVSVCIFSQVPMEDIEVVYLDYQSRTSVKLAQILLKNYWKQDVVFKPATENFIEYINGTNAGVIIGDRALQQLNNFGYVYDLATAWKDFTGLPFVFAAWIANKDLPADFIRLFNEANKEGLNHIDEVVSENHFPYYDLKKYYTENIHYFLDEEKKKGMELFLSMIKDDDLL